MLTMTTCRRWILVLVTGSAILAGILAAPDTEDSAKPAVNNGRIQPPGADEETRGVEETLAGAKLTSSGSSKEEEIPTTTTATIVGEVSKRTLIPLGENKKLSTTGKIKYDGKHAKDPTSTGLMKAESSIEAIPLTRSTNSGDAASRETPGPASSSSASSNIADKVNVENRTASVGAGARSLDGNDLAVTAITDDKVDTRNSLHGNVTDLSDVSMDYDYKDIEGGEYLAGAGNVSGTNADLPPALVIPSSVPGITVTSCTYGNETFAPGMSVKRNCDDQCVCGEDGNLANCRPLCVTPFIRAGRGIQDPLCQEKLTPDNPCCATLICEQDSEPEPEEFCYLGNKTLARGDTAEDGCTKVCICEARGTLKCRPRCPQSNSTSTSMAAASANQRDKCVPVRDPRDACCTITLCDVTLGDLDQFKPESLPGEGIANLTKVEALNSTAIKLIFSNNMTGPELHGTVELSMDHLLWRDQKLDKDGIIGNLEPSRTYYVRVSDEGGRRPGASMHVVLPSKSSAESMDNKINGNGTLLSPVSGGGCNHRGKWYKVGAEWYDECISFCTCSIVENNTPKTECATIECPTDFGLDVLDPNCIDWEWVPADFVPIPPQCCSQEVRCRNNGSCNYQGESYNNWSEIPSNVTGCEKRCYCELGNVSCHSACPPVTALPPPNLKCPPSHASLMHLPEDECCLHWVCGDSTTTGSLPANFGRNGTPPYPGPLATDSINQLHQSIDDRKTIPSAGMSGPGNLHQWTVMQGLTDRYATLPRRKYHESYDLDSTSNRPDADVTDDPGLIHYPMDPGHPTTKTPRPPPPPPPPYQGPYDPDYRPTRPSVEDVFRLTPAPTHPKTNQFHQAPKDRQKSKTESIKKVIEPAAKPNNKDASAFAGEAHFSPEIIPGKETSNASLHPTITVPAATFDRNYKLPASPYRKNNSSPIAQPPQDAYKIFPHHVGADGESTVPHFPFHREFDETVPAPGPGPVRYGGASPGPAATGLEGPNAILTGDHQNNNIGTREPAIASFERGREPAPQRPPLRSPAQIYNDGNSGPAPNRPAQGAQGAQGEDPNDHELPEELYRLINLQHPGLIRLNDDPPEGHQGLYGVIGQGQGTNDHEGIGQVDGPHHPGTFQYFNPQIFTATGGEGYGGGAGANGYNHANHAHGGPAGIPGGARQQIEELLLRVGEKDPNIGPFQRYPNGQEPTTGRKPPIIIGPSRVAIPGHVPQNSGLPPRLNHPLLPGTTMIHDIHSPSGPDHGLPPGFPVHGGPGVQPSSDQVTVQTLEAISENRVRLVFTVPHVLVGLHGRVEVRYTSKESNVDPATWKSQIFAPPDDLIATPQLEFELGDLTPSTEYKVMVTVKLRDLSNSPTSKIYTVTTLEALNADVVTLPPQIPIDAELTVAEANSTWADIVWKKFTKYELQFIDGVQLRYKETDGKVYAATPLIHRAVTSYVVENLKPAVTYEVGIYFIPFPGQTTELVSEKPINFTTSAEPDLYSFDIKVEIKGIKSTEVEVAWRGVPYPEDKYVNIYRAIYQSDTGKEDMSTFEIAKRDSPARTMIGKLKPGTRYRLWIEVYLTNGRTKKSNVQDFVTKPGIPASAGVLEQGKFAAQIPLHEGDYYGPLVIVAIVASLAILSTLILLMMLMKRRSSSKADISPRKTTAAYDNPSYKTCEYVASTVSCSNGEKIGSMITLRNDDEHHSKEPA